MPRVGFAYRIGVALVGGAIVLLGLILVPLPGPGWAVVVAGLAVLASEFAWAHRLLRYVRRRLSEWASWVRRQPPFTRLVLGATVLLLMAAAVLGWVAWRGVPGWVPGIG